jgi:glycogen phosphorylase
MARSSPLSRRVRYITGVTAGSSDINSAVEALRSRLPEPLAPLADLAYNYRWSWTPGGPELLSSV